MLNQKKNKQKGFKLQKCALQALLADSQNRNKQFYELSPQSNWKNHYDFQRKYQSCEFKSAKKQPQIQCKELSNSLTKQQDKTAINSSRPTNIRKLLNFYFKKSHSKQQSMINVPVCISKKKSINDHELSSVKINNFAEIKQKLSQLTLYKYRKNPFGPQNEITKNKHYSFLENKQKEQRIKNPFLIKIIKNNY